MKKNSRFALVGITAGAGVVGLMLLTAPVQAKKPFSAIEIQDHTDALLVAVKKGDDLWHDGKLGTNGLACANCHPDGSASNPHTWPKYQTNLGKVGTLRDMINWCIVVPLEGKALKHESDEMIALEAYATYMHNGVPIELGKDEQHGANPVKEGPGYPMYQSR